MDEKNKKASDDIQRRRFMLTINNPEKYEMSHEKIIEAIHSAFAKQGILYFACVTKSVKAALTTPIFSL